MTNERLLYDMLGRLIEWEQMMGGWDSKVWREARDLRQVIIVNDGPKTSWADDMANPRYPDWQYQVANNDTRLGFADWLEHTPEEHREGAGVTPCEYCGEKACDYSCDESQAGGFQTGFRSMTVCAREIKPGDTLEEFGLVDFVEATDSNIQIGYARDGNWGDFAPDAKIVRMNKES